MQPFFLVYFDIHDIYDDPFGPKHVVNKFPAYMINIFCIRQCIFLYFYYQQFIYQKTDHTNILQQFYPRMSFSVLKECRIKSFIFLLREYSSAAYQVCSTYKKVQQHVPSIPQSLLSHSMQNLRTGFFGLCLESILLEFDK